MVNIEIDGKLLPARKGAMIIEVADEAGIAIPRFCYHKKLSIAANCRMCLIEVEKVGKPLPACATPVADGMKVFTRSRMALDAQQGTMEFLLINHPLDCPICDQGGECDLQDLSMGYGEGMSRFRENKLVVKDKDIGPLIQTDMTRCIKCTLCVRFGDELAGMKELGATGRGEHVVIETYFDDRVTSEMSGNVIDLCPVGALTSKPFRYTSRPWELTSHQSIAPHDAIGSNIYLHSLANQVRRVLPRENEQINECWISDRDRYSYEGLNSEDRLTVPMIRVRGEWQETDWNTALETVAAGLRAIISDHGARQLGFLMSPSSTVEEMYLAQKLARGLGTDNIDHRLRQLDFRDQELMPRFPWLGQTLDELEANNAVLLIGSNVRKDQPIVGHRLRKATRKGMHVMFVNLLDYDFNFRVAEKIIASPAAVERALAGIVKALADVCKTALPVGIDKLAGAIEITDAMRAIASQLHAGEKTAVILGTQAMAHPAFSTLNALAGAIARMSGARLGYLPDGANSLGGWIAGAVPHRGAGGQPAGERGLSARGMLDGGLKGYLLNNFEPEYDCADPVTALRAFGEAEFVAVLTSYRNTAMERYARVMLPAAPFSETSGTYVNAEGRWQSFTGAVTPVGSARPAWKVFRVLGNLCGVDGFNQIVSTDARDELRKLLGDFTLNGNQVTWHCPAELSRDAGSGANGTGLTRVSDVPVYAVDSIVRRSAPLRQSADMTPAGAYINSGLADRLGLADVAQVIVRQGNHQATLPLLIDRRVPDMCVYVPAGLEATAGLGASTAAVELERI